MKLTGIPLKIKPSKLQPRLFRSDRLQFRSGFFWLLFVLIGAIPLLAGTKWDGTVSTDWNDPNNWSSGVPDSSENVTIKSNTPYNPIVPAGAAVKNLEIKNGGVLNFAGTGTLTVHGDIATKNDGTVNLGTGTITFLKDVSISNNGTFNADSGNIEMNGGEWNSKNGSTFNAGTSTVTFGGSSDQEIKGDVTFANVVVNTSGELKIKDTVTATNFDLNSGSTLDAPDLTVTGVFNIDGTYDSATTITVQSGANLILLSTDSINDGSNLVLAGGTFNPNGYDETMDTLTLSQTSTINFSGSNSQINFADSSGETWSGTLEITNYTPLGDKLYFGNSGSGLTQNQVDKIRFIDPYSNGVDYTAIITMSGEVVIGSAVVPEASTLFALLGICMVIGVHERRRILRQRLEDVSAPT